MGTFWHRAKPFRRALIRAEGVSLEHAAHAAWEAGYFPHVAPPRLDGSDNMQPVSGDMLIAAINRELAARPDMEPEPPPPADDDYWQGWEADIEGERVQ